MKVIRAEKARELRAGNAHFHWVCFDKLNFISKPYYCSLSEVGKVADRHRDKYRNHKKKVFIFTCHRKCGE